MAMLEGRQSELVDYYLEAKCWIEGSPFVQEVECQKRVVSEGVTSEAAFLREYAWVVLNSGFREAVVRKHFNYISLSFCDWESAEVISQNRDVCVRCASSVFGHHGKLHAIGETASLIAKNGFDWLKQGLEVDALSTLGSLQYIGDVTKWHLAKNIGLDVAKPDRHLVRLARRFGYTDVHRMCRDVHEQCGDLISVADLILWRFEERSPTAKYRRQEIRS